MDMNIVNQSIGELNISVDNSKLKAYVYISYSIQDTTNKQDNCAADSQKYIFKEIEEALKVKGIVYGILYENFKEAIKGGMEIQIAQGTPPKSPTDDKIEYYFPTRQNRTLREEDGKIDYMDAGSIFFVKENTLLARVIEGKEGTPGIDIFGRIIPNEKKKRKVIKKGPNCEYTPDRMGIVSKISGMPCLKNDTITVFNTYSLNNDVDPKTGNIVFDGNILINGNVKEGMKVYSRGFITIAGNVDSSEIRSDGDITIMKNLICSTVRAGAEEVLNPMALKYLKDITEFFMSFTDSIEDLLKNAALSENSSMVSIIKALLQLKFKDIKQVVSTSATYFKSTKNDSNIEALFYDSLKLYKLLDTGMLANLELLTKQAERNTDYIVGYENIFSTSNATIYSCQNSTIYATNNVIISGKGCYNTNIFTKNNVFFTGYPGIFRGGSISASGSISVRELGSNAEVHTVIRTSKNGVVTAEKIYPNVLIYFDSMLYRVEGAYKHFKAFIKDREIIIEKQML